MTSYNPKHAIGIFPSRQNAEQALIELKDKSFPMHKISVITKSSDQNDLNNRGVQQPPITRAEGAKAGALLGSTGVGLLTLAVGLSVLLIPGVGPALAVEGLLTTVLGSGAAAIVGGLYGALQGWLVPEEQARIYNDRLNQGDYLVVIEAVEDEIQLAEPILNRWGTRAWRVYDAD
ncbi:MAG: signal transduction histidine kinase (STHK), LytS [Myxacorys chilensis ATA2-1-KO14]|jgi:hypothetical protein|nr:signal transduction histidine kinase (STHK), LytS [Myxacorys chilensis ATA2-1-KO14]